MVLADSPLAGTRRVGGILPRFFGREKGKVCGREKGKVCKIRTQNPEILGEILTTLTAPLKEQVKWYEIQGICTRYGEVDNTRWSCIVASAAVFLTAVPPCPPPTHCMHTSHLLSIALVECANLFPERILLILTRCVRLSSEKSACATSATSATSAKVRPAWWSWVKHSSK